MIEEGSTAVANLIEGVRRPAQSTRKLQQLYRPVKEPLQKGFANDPVMMRTQA